MLTRTEWVSRNKKKLVREFFRKTNLSKSEPPVGIFMAGLPGAGKTEFTRGLLVDLDPKPLRLDMDEIAELVEGYNPKIADAFRGAASILLSTFYDHTLKFRNDFIFDGTFSYGKAIDNIRRAIDRHNYTVKLYFIYQDPVIAWRFTKDREITEFRGINREGFILTYQKMFANLRELQSSHKDVTVSIILKDKNNKEGQRFEAVKDIFDYIPAELSLSELKNVIIE